MKRSLFTFIFSILCVGMFFANVSAHKFHSTLTRIDFNERSKNIEISVEFFTHDLDILLEKRLGKSADAFDSKKIDAELFKYINERFVLSFGEKPVKFEFVGREYATDLTAIYFETPFSDCSKDYSLANGLFAEQYQEQVNYVVAQCNEKRISLNYKGGDNPKASASNNTRNKYSSFQKMRERVLESNSSN